MSVFQFLLKCCKCNFTDCADVAANTTCGTDCPSTVTITWNGASAACSIDGVLDGTGVHIATCSGNCSAWTIATGSISGQTGDCDCGCTDATPAYTSGISGGGSRIFCKDGCSPSLWGITAGITPLCIQLRGALILAYACTTGIEGNIQGAGTLDFSGSPSPVGTYSTTCGTAHPCTNPVGSCGTMVVS